MANINPKKSSILGSNAFNFIASMVSKSVNQETATLANISDTKSTESISDLNQLVSLEIKTDTEPETENTDQSVDFSLKTDANTETDSIETSLSCKLLSVSAPGEFVKENFLKGCKWLEIQYYDTIVLILMNNSIQLGHQTALVS